MAALKNILKGIIILILFAGCTSSKDVQEIEILSYFTNANDFQIYATIDNEGFAQVLSRSETNDSVVDNYRIKIRQSLLDSIEDICNQKTENDLKSFKKEEGMWYCGDKHSVKITFENGEIYTFQFSYVNESNQQFIPFQSVFNEVRNDSASAKRWGFEKLGALYLKQESMSGYYHKIDVARWQKLDRKR